MTVTWEEASSELINMAEEVIEDHHPHLRDARIGFVFRSEVSVSNGRETWGKASKVTDKLKPFVDDIQFVIWIAKDKWEAISTDQRRALLDHELCHCRFNINTGNPAMRHHDFEEFHEIIQRHGFWNHELFKLQRNIEKQLRLPISEMPSTGKVVAINPSPELESID